MFVLADAAVFQRYSPTSKAPPCLGPSPCLGIKRQRSIREAWGHPCFGRVRGFPRQRFFFDSGPHVWQSPCPTPYCLGSLFAYLKNSIFPCIVFHIVTWFVQASDWDPCLGLGEESKIIFFNSCQDPKSKFLWLATISGSTIGWRGWWRWGELLSLAPKSGLSSSSPPDESPDKNWFLPFANPTKQTWMLAILGRKLWLNPWSLQTQFWSEKVSFSFSATTYGSPMEKSHSK